MEQPPKGQIQPARLAAMETEMRYPMGMVDMTYRKSTKEGVLYDEAQTLRLAVTSEEARQISAQFLKLADAIKSTDTKAQ